jgi:hypothetical protein
VNFQVNEYLVRGNTLLDPATIEDSVEPYLGPNRSMNDVHAHAMRCKSCIRPAVINPSWWKCRRSK